MSAVDCEHPAVSIWSKLSGKPLTCPGIEILKPEVRKSAVYRLQGAGPDGVSVIAKRCRLQTARVERTIYQEVISRLPLPAVRLYGMTPDDDGVTGWLFLEDAGDEAFSPSRAEHRAAAAEWLATLHASGLGQRVREEIPAQSLSFLHDVVQASRAVLRHGLENPAMTSLQAETLQQILRQCDTVESRWQEMGRILGELPETLVHGDFGQKNVRVKSAPQGVVLYPLDWETAAWGAPAADISIVDLGRYWEILSRSNPRLTPAAVQRAVHVGKILWAIAPIRGEWGSVEIAYLDNIVQKFEYYRLGIESALKELGWTH